MKNYHQIHLMAAHDALPLMTHANLLSALVKLFIAGYREACFLIHRRVADGFAHIIKAMKNWSFFYGQDLLQNVLFVCKLIPVRTDDDLEVIFSRFGKVKTCEVMRDRKSEDALQYAFVKFDEKKACEAAFFKMDNVLIVMIAEFT
ncbi:hypothetical protein GQX74_000697 [Glossina fuscipes]|nr:hypothetical protein GQX74_000697 [Glossina fuscipes]